MRLRINFLFLILNLIFCVFAADSGNSFKYQLSIVALFRDEGRFLKEWIEYHRMLGVEHFYLINHMSTDDFMSVLQPYLDTGLVELSNSRTDPDNYSEWRKYHQSLLEKIILKSKGETKWLAIIDTDEFICPKVDNNLLSFLSRYDNYGGVAIFWTKFGTSNIQKISSDKLMIETLMYSMPEDYRGDFFCKSIVQPLKVKKLDGWTHSCVYYKPYYAVNCNYDLVDRKNINTSCNLKSKKIICINHYWTRDEEFYAKYKANLSKQKHYFKVYSQFMEETMSVMNLYYNPSILKYVAELRLRMGLD